MDTPNTTGKTILINVTFSDMWIVPCFSHSYHGAQIFEIYGLDEDVVDTAFRGSVSRIGGLTLNEVLFATLLPASKV